MNFSIDISGDDEAIYELENLSRNIQGTVAKVLQNGGQQGQKEAKRMAPVDTWFMHDNIESYIVTQLHVVLHSRAFYSGYVNGGTRYQDAQPFFDYGIAKAIAYLNEHLPLVVEGELR